jgi:hypothetical protein
LGDNELPRRLSTETYLGSRTIYLWRGRHASGVWLASKPHEMARHFLFCLHSRPRCPRIATLINAPAEGHPRKIGINRRVKYAASESLWRFGTMLKTSGHYCLEVIAPGSLIVERLTLNPFPPGTNVYASISLSGINTLFEGASERDPHFTAVAYVESWTFYQTDGTESGPQTVTNQFTQNAVMVENCARITFALAGAGVNAFAQINVFTDE